MISRNGKVRLWVRKGICRLVTGTGTGTDYCKKLKFRKSTGTESFFYCIVQKWYVNGNVLVDFVRVRVRERGKWDFEVRARNP